LIAVKSGAGWLVSSIAVIRKQRGRMII
jgi:hypothetical protein